VNRRSICLVCLLIITIAAGCQTPEQRALEVSHNLLIAGAQKDVRAGRLDAAIHKLRRAVNLKPEDAVARFSLGNVLARRAEEPDVSAEALTTLVTEALEHHTAALRLVPDSAQAHYHVGRDLILLGRPAEAVGYLEAARKRDPNAPFIDARLGDAHRLMKQYDLALEHYRAGLTKRPKPLAAMELHEGLADTYLATGKPVDALAALQQARKKAPTRAHLKRIEKRIEELHNKPAPG